MDCRISVIIPVYNSVKTLERAVKSVLEQTYREFEILLIDDGSTDGSGTLCDSYSLHYQEISVIHTPNRRQGAARNTGIKNAAGDFIFFLDADDYILPDTLELLLNALESHSADISVCASFLERNGKIQTEPDTDFVLEMPVYEALKSYTEGTVYASHCPCDKLYRKKVFNNTGFTEDRYFEDLCSVFRFVGQADKVVYIDKKRYCYVCTPGSTMRRPFGANNYDAIYGYNALKEYLSVKYPDLASKAEALSFNSILYCVGETFRLHKQNEMNDKLIWAVSMAERIDVHCLSLKKKALRLVLIKFPRLYGKIYSITK